jgi:lysophospholipase L1-like esterase
MTLSQINNNIVSMVELAQANDIQVVLCSVLPAYDYPWREGMIPNIKIPQLNAMLKQYASESGIYFLDYFKAMADERNGLPKKYAEDGVHPTREGYDLMKELLINALNETMTQR